MEMLYFVDKDDPKRKRLALSAISQKVGTLSTPISDPQRPIQTLHMSCRRQVDRYAPMPTPPDALSPRSRSRVNRTARRAEVSGREVTPCSMWAVVLHTKLFCTDLNAPVPVFHQAKRNDGTLACMARQLLQQHFRVTVSARKIHFAFSY